jgi:predicted O-linked N-acetylglucosamine transferase (SPINDLY family)
VNGRAATRFRQPDFAHQMATAYVPALRNALENCHEAGRAAARAQALASTISESLPQLREQLVKLSRTIQRAERAMKVPEEAIEAIVREVGLQGAKLALSALHREFHLPVELAIKAVESVLELGISLGR